MDGKKLYQRVIEEDVPFYDWQFWIDKTLDRVYFEQKYRSQNKNRRKSVKDPKVIALEDDIGREMFSM